MTQNEPRSPLTRVAQKAWQNPAIGEMEIDGHRVVKDGKIVIVTQETNGRKVVSVAFPKMEHLSEFEQAAKGTDSGGPAQNNPGGIGTLEMVRLPGPSAFTQSRPAPAAVQKCDQVWMLQTAQAHFKTKTWGSQRPTLSRTRATQYLGWRIRALHEAVKHCKKSGIPLIIEKTTHINEFLLAEREDGKPSPLMQEIKKVTQENGWRLSENRHFIAIHPSETE